VEEVDTSKLAIFAGMKVLITRPRSQADEFAVKLRAAGFEPVYFPVIEIREVENNIELDNAIKNIQKYTWVVFTSANAVDVVLKMYSQFLDGSGVKVAAIGSKTAQALRHWNIEPDFIPAEYISEAILSGLGDVTHKWILLPRAKIARPELPAAIVKADGVAHEIVVYQTLPAEIDVEGLNALKSGVDVVTFTSESSVDNFVAIVLRHHLDPLSLPNNPLFACIGPVTERAARDAGFKNLAVAKEYTTEGLIQLLKADRPNS